MNTEERIAALEARVQKQEAKIAMLTASLMLSELQSLTAENIAAMRERLLADLLPSNQSEGSLDGITEQSAAMISYLQSVRR